MSIDARIVAVTVVAPTHCDMCSGTGKEPGSNRELCPVCHGATRENPVVRLRLEPREPGGLAGQPTLVLLNPPTLDPQVLTGMVGTEIWGGCTDILVGSRLWAKRIGYTRIELV